MERRRARCPASSSLAPRSTRAGGRALTSAHSLAAPTGSMAWSLKADPRGVLGERGDVEALVEGPHKLPAADGAA